MTVFDMARLRRAWGCAFVLAGLLAGCTREASVSQSADLASSVVERVFSDEFDSLETIAIPVREAGLTTVRSLDVDDRGRLLIAGGRSGHLSLVDPSGAVTMTIGRTGSGPGEFRAAFDARFLPDGGIVAIDPQLARVSFFDTSGHFVTSFNVTKQDPRVIRVKDDSVVVIGGLYDVGGKEHLAVEYSRHGTVKNSFGPMDKLMYEIDFAVDQPWLAILGDGWMATGLTVSLHATLKPREGGTVSLTLPIPPDRWKQIARPAVPFETPGDVRRWASAASAINGVAVEGDSLILITWRGDGANASGGDQHFLAILDPHGMSRSVLRSVPGPILYSDGVKTYFTTEGTDDEVHVAAYRRRAPARAPGSLKGGACP